MIFGDNPQIINEHTDMFGRKRYTVVHSSWAIMQAGNLFAYTMNNPVMFSDPSGRVAWPLIPPIYKGLQWIVKAVGTVVAGIAVADSIYNAPRIFDTGTAGNHASINAAGNSVFARDLDVIAGGYGNLMCMQAAASMAAHLRNNNRRGETLTLSWTGGVRDYVISVSNPIGAPGGVISNNATHRGVLFNGLVRCNVHPQGLPEARWIADFMSSGVLTVIRVPI